MPAAKGGAEQSSEFQLSTAPFDSRFPNTNQTRNCWQNYVDYYRCIKMKGETYSLCDYFKKTFTVMCPSAWVEEWDDQREKGAFAGRI